MGGVQLKYGFWGGLKERQKDKRKRGFHNKRRSKGGINMPVIKHSETWKKVDPRHNTGPKIVLKTLKLKGKMLSLQFKKDFHKHTVMPTT